MRYKPEQREKTRKRIVRSAGAVFRLKGFHGIGVDGLMSAAKMTSGAFYGHFDSKGEVFREVVRDGMHNLYATIDNAQSTSGENWLTAFAEHYLSLNHRQDLSESCVLPSMGEEIVRSDPKTREMFEGELIKIKNLMASQFKNHPPEEEDDQTAFGALAILAGGVMLSRAVPSQSVAEEILNSCRAAARKLLI
jgi:AcrR family transcriptional regulator